MASKMIVRIIPALMLTIISPQIATASEWLYCIAPSYTERKLYMSPVFATNSPGNSVESAFATVLDQSFLRYNDIQCPKSKDEFSAMEMQQQTVKFNQSVGNTIINLRWKPKP